MRSPVVRALAVLASVFLVVTHWDARTGWFWVGVVLLVLNVVGLLAARPGASRAPSTTAGPATSPVPHEDGVSHRLADLLGVPGVAAALADGPQRWRQVSHLDGDARRPLSPVELAAYVWIEDHGGWAIAVGDEVEPYVDLDLDEASDPVISVLRAHPAVADAVHEDREVYRVVQHRDLSTEEFAELAARALVAHHLHAAARS